MNSKYTMLHDSQFVESVRELIKKSSILKGETFKSLIKNDSINATVGRNFITQMNNFLAFWESFANDMNGKINATSLSNEKIRTISYDTVKIWLYDKYDYAASLQFTDGIIKLIADGNCSTREDVDDFFKSTIAKAFGDDKADSVGGLVDSVLWTNIMDWSNSVPETKMFNTLKGRPIVSGRDRAELVNAAKKVIEFISHTDTITKYLNGDNLKVMIASVNDIIEFIVYSAIIYAARIYMINSFAYPIIMNGTRGELTPVGESAEINLPGGDNHMPIEITVMRDADEALIKDPNNFKALFDLATECSTAIGSDSIFGEGKPVNWSKYDYGKFHLNKNRFTDKLVNNDLYRLMASRCNIWGGDYHEICEINAILKNITRNPLQAIQGNNSPRQEFLAIIRGTEPDTESVKGYQELYAELFSCMIPFIKFLGTTLLDSVGLAAHELTDRSGMNVTDRNLNAENYRILGDLYSELVFVFLQKARDIESKYNSLNNANINKAIGLNIPGEMKINSTVSDITPAVPDSSRVPIDLTDLYALPAFESMQYYDEAVKELYGLRNDLYFSEAFNISENMNKVQALIKSIVDKIKNWIHDAQVSNAVKYVKEHNATLSRLTFGADATMEVLPFKNNGSAESINLQQIVTNLTNGLGKFDTKDIESPEAVTAFLKAIYPSEEVYNWFEGGDKEAATKFRNWVLYQDGKDGNSNVQKITGDEIAKRMKWWIDTVQNAEAICQQLVDLGTKLTQSTDQIKSKVSNVTGQQGSQQPVKQDPGPSQPGNTTEQKNEQTNQNTENTEKASNCSQLLDGIQAVISRVYIPMNEICRFYILTEYRYIREAYSKASTATQSTNEQPTQQ